MKLQIRVNSTNKKQELEGEHLCGAPGDPTEGCSNQGKGGGVKAHHLQELLLVKS